MGFNKEQLLYIGNNHFVSANDTMYEADELLKQLIAKKDGLTDVDILINNRYGGHERYIYKSIGTSYEIVIENKYMKMQEKFDEVFDQMRRQVKRHKKGNKFIAGAAAALVAGAVAPQAAQSINDIYKDLTTPDEMAEERSKNAPIINYLHQERDRLEGGDLTNSNFNLTEEQMFIEARNIADYFQQNYSPTEIESFISGSVLTKEGEQAVSSYFNSKKQLYSTNASSFQNTENYDVKVSPKGM